MQGGDLQRRRRSIGEGQRTGGRVELAHEERRFLHLDLPAVPTQRDDEDVLAVRSRAGEKANTSIESLAQTAIQDGLTLVGPGAVVVKNQAERA